jgi:hypothetical protein
MIPPQVVLKALVQRLLPSPPATSGPESDKSLRSGPWGDLKVENIWPTDHLQADEGAYMLACMAPGQTGLFNGLKATYATADLVVAASMTLFNNAPPNMGVGGPNLYPRYARFVCSQAPTGGTALLYCVIIDNTNRSPTTNNSLIGQSGIAAAATGGGYKPTVVCTNMAVSPQINGVPFFVNSTTAGNLMAVPSPSGNARTIVGQGLIKNGIPVLLDEYTIAFGSQDRGGSFQSATGIGKYVEHAPPVVIGPGQSMTLFLWSPGNTGTGGNQWSDASLEWVER